MHMRSASHCLYNLDVLRSEVGMLLKTCIIVIYVQNSSRTTPRYRQLTTSILHVQGVGSLAYAFK